MDGRTTDGRATEPAYTISSPGAFGSGELKYLFSTKEPNEILIHVIPSEHGKSSVNHLC